MLAGTMNMYRVEQQLAAKRAAGALPASVLPPAEPNLLVLNDPVKVGKVRRAYLKAGLEASADEQRLFLIKLLALGVPVCHRGSRRIAKVLTGEQPIESLLKKQVHKPKATQ